jgi:hypothetical protein
LRRVPHGAQEWRVRYKPLLRGAAYRPKTLPVSAESGALDAALNLMRFPALASAIAARKVPDDVIDVMRVAASRKARLAVAARVGVPADLLQDAARVYLKRALFHPDADCYRVLGVRPGASCEEARHHLRWLLTWLHPDRNSGWDAQYAARVIAAWRELCVLKTSPPAADPGARCRNDAAARARGLKRPNPSSFRMPLVAVPVAREARGEADTRNWLVVAITCLVFLAAVIAFQAWWKLDRVSLDASSEKPRLASRGPAMRAVHGPISVARLR